MLFKALVSHAFNNTHCVFIVHVKVKCVRAETSGTGDVLSQGLYTQCVKMFKGVQIIKYGYIKP